MKNKNEIIKIGDGIYQIKYYWLGLANVYCFVIVGKEKALMIDSCYSTTHAIDYAKSVTDLRIILVNTHGHFDHIGGDSDFEEVYMAAEDLEIAKMHSDEVLLTKMLNDYRKKNGLLGRLLYLPNFSRQMKASAKIKKAQFLPLPAEGYFELGHRKVSFIHTPGHTPGSICLMDENTGYFFTGDMACQEGVLLGFEYSTSVSKYKESILKMKQYFKENGGKKVIPSHHQLPASEDVFDKIINACDQIISGNVKGKPHDDGLTCGSIATYNHVTINYQRVHDA